jgi:hypothetical protein
MKNLNCLLTILLTACFSGCIREEAPNTEADILECIVDPDILKREPIIQNNRVLLLIKTNTDPSRQAPQFLLTEGATIEPASGTALDFTTPQNYVVTSEDGNWKKTYSIAYIRDELPTTFHFEDTIPETNNKYYIFAEKQDGVVSMEWATGNPGFLFTGAAHTPEDFPTTQYNDGYRGKCACMTTRKTGSFGEMIKIPIAAGNLFIGTFNVSDALSNSPLKATRFGLPFHQIPVSFSGYYKYKAGADYYEDGQVTPGKKDRCHFYAVLYESDNELRTLDGINVLTHPNILATAVIQDQRETDEWVFFQIPFTYREGKSIDPEKLINGHYNLAVVFTSSIEGGSFKGAPGSRLLIDEVVISVVTNNDES